MSRPIYTISILIASFFICSVGSATTYSNSYNNMGIGPLSYSTNNSTNTSFGEAFTITEGGILSDWTFYTFEFDNFTPGNLMLAIAEWNDMPGSHIEPAIYTSPYRFHEGGNQSLLFSGINTYLAAGSYVAYLTVAGVPNPVTTVTDEAGVPIPLSGVVLQQGSSGGGIGIGATHSWGSNFLDLELSHISNEPEYIRHLRFTANISPVPAPPAFLLMLTGLGVLGLTKRFRKADKEA